MSDVTDEMKTDFEEIARLANDADGSLADGDIGSATDSVETIRHIARSWT